jgi:hypothetical protein
MQFYSKIYHDPNPYSQEGSMSVLDRSMAAVGVRVVSALVRALFRGPAKRQHGHLIAGVRKDDGSASTVLIEKSFGRRGWAHRYDNIARKKFGISVRTGLSSREVQQMRPDLLEVDDTIYWGSAVVGNIVVAFSGIQPWFDEAISYALAYLLRALIQDRLEELKASALEADADLYDGEAA